MNLNFTFTTRDKILLLVLAVILFVGMMYLYGVMPANEEVEDLEGQITAKQQELAQLQAQIAGINIAGIDAEYDKLLDYYYTADRGELAENIGIIAINRMIVAVLDEHNISGYSTTGWKITEERLTGSYGDYTGDYYIASATCPVPYTAAPEDLYALIDYVNEDPFLIMTDLSINYVEETPETEEPTEPGTDTEPTEPGTGTEPVEPEPVEPVIKAEGSFNLIYYMRVPKGAATVPALLGTVTGLTAEGATLTFDSVANATGYEFYTVTETEGGKTYSLIDNYTVNATAGETVSVTFTSALLNAGEHTIAVRAVGDKMAGWFKSAPLETDGNAMTAVITVA